MKWLTDPKTKKPSITATLLVSGFVAATAKLAMSGLVIHGFHFEAFSGTDYAMVIGALGALYGLRKYNDGKLDYVATKRTSKTEEKIEEITPIGE